MSSGIDLQLIKDYYQGITNQQLIHILAENSEGLTADAIQIIKEEIISRGLKPEMLAGVEAYQETDELAFDVFDPDGCPVDEENRVWLEKSFSHLLDIFGRPATKNRRVLIPDRSCFPVRFDGSERAAFEALEIVSKQMEVPFEKIRIDFYDEQLRYITEGTPGGLYWGKQEADTYEISIARELLDEPEELVATIAHEISHIKLLGENRMEENDEKMTDMTTMFFGMGIFNANAAFKTFNSGWSSSGYLTQMEWGYVLALFAQIRNETQPDWLQHLCTNVKADFLKSQRYIANSRTRFF